MEHKASNWLEIGIQEYLDCFKVVPSGCSIEERDKRLKAFANVFSLDFMRPYDPLVKIGDLVRGKDERQPIQMPRPCGYEQLCIASYSVFRCREPMIDGKQHRIVVGHSLETIQNVESALKGRYIEIWKQVNGIELVALPNQYSWYFPDGAILILMMSEEVFCVMNATINKLKRGFS